jgi:hypothetical protein
MRVSEATCIAVAFRAAVSYCTTYVSGGGGGSASRCLREVSVRGRLPCACEGKASTSDVIDLLTNVQYCTYIPFRSPRAYSYSQTYAHDLFVLLYLLTNLWLFHVCRTEQTPALLFNQFMDSLTLSLPQPHSGRRAVDSSIGSILYVFPGGYVPPEGSYGPIRFTTSN